MKTVLFFAEDVTMAQVVRLVVLARALDPARYQVHFACHNFDDMVFRPGEFTRHTIFTVPRDEVQKALAKGKRIYEDKTLRGYVREDLGIIEKVRPDLVVGDFRLSLPISAPAAGVPLATMINGYWSPRAQRTLFPVPDHPILSVVGETIAQRYFPQAMPKAFEHFAKPVNVLRKEHRLPEIGSLLEVLTHGDYTLYPDVPMVTPVSSLLPGERFLGPILWSPEVPLPPWWNELPPESERPIVYATLGSSGNLRALPEVVAALGELPVTAILATAGRTDLGRLPKNVHASAFVPGHLAARRASLVICNGGSTTGYQALAEGRPVLGIAANLDQHLAAQAMQECGAGIRLRSSSVRAQDVRKAVTTLLESASHRERALAVQAEFGRWDAGANFAKLVDEALGMTRTHSTGEAARA